jgi:hypothetical protein
MGARATQVEIANRGAVLAVAGQGTHEKHLIRGHLTVINAAFGQTVITLEVKGRYDLPVCNKVPQVGRVGGQRIVY